MQGFQGREGQRLALVLLNLCHPEDEGDYLEAIKNGGMVESLCQFLGTLEPYILVFFFEMKYVLFIFFGKVQTSSYLFD